MSKMVKVPSSPLIDAYLAEPANEPKGGVIVIHEVWGLDKHIKSVADRLAVEGYTALTPDFFSAAKIDTSSIAGMQEALFDPKRRNQIQPELRKIMAPMQNPKFGEQTIQRVKDCFDYLYNLPGSRQSVVVMGFCFGGTYSFSLAAREPRLLAALPFYGHTDDDVETLKNIKCPVLAFYGENDERLISGLSELKDNMKVANVNFTAKIYANCGHAFFNDTNRFSYNKEAAEDAWRLTLDLLNKVIR